MSVFDRYAPFVQDFIYEHGWEQLRGIQVAAADAIFNTDDNVLLAASTASGKTEAAFFPILSLFDEDPPASVGAIYVGPLKALINDQFYRLNDLCEQADIPVWHWHGDVSASHKERMLKHPSGVLQITPESLEALLLHKHAAIPKLFCDLRFVVIDEVHSLLRADRGGQTLCCIERLSRMAGVNPRRIGLSATIGDPQLTGQILSRGTGRGCVIPQVKEQGRTWRLSMEHFFITGPQAVQQKAGPHTQIGGGTPAVGPSLEPASDVAPEHADLGIGYIFEHTKDAKCLVFVNSREECEAVTTSLRRYCEATGQPDRFLIHHGNLSSALRESAEDAMRDDDRCFTTVTTATLELGIDIGRLERAFQIDAPFTVSSFLQRMGRTGRRERPCEMWFVMREEEPEPRALMPECIPWKLIQGIALVQVYIEERWVEPPRTGRLPFSLLYHQTMATLASCGEMSAGQLANRVLSLSCFDNISLEDYQVLLRHLLQIDHIQRTDEGGLIVGLAGEQVTGSFKFYATFQDNEEYTVRCESMELGTIVCPPPAGELVAIAGHVWLVEEVDHKRHLVYTTQVKGKIPAYFGEVAGDINTHVLERMQRVLAEDQQYLYLMGNATRRLAEARHLARESGLVVGGADRVVIASGAGELPERAGDTGYAPVRAGDAPEVLPQAGKGLAAGEWLINLGGDTWALFPWLGTYAFMALERLLKVKVAPRLGIKGVQSAKPYYLQFRMQASREEFIACMCEQAEAIESPLELVYPDEVPVFDKYDEFVPDELVRKGFAYGVLDLEGMRQRVRQW